MRKGRREEATQGGASEAGKEGGSETERTKEGKEGGREAGGRKEERVAPSNEAEE